MRISLTRIAPLSFLVFLSSAVPASANGWLRELHAMRAEYQAEFEKAQMLAKLDCAALSAYVAEQNWLTNQRIHAEYHRPLPRSWAVSPPADPGLPPYLVVPRPR
jgi:hypothetical protein